MSESPVSHQSIPYGNGGSATPQYANAQGGASNESAVRKKLNGYVGFANLPNQVHRKSVRTGFQFTVMVVGEFLPLIKTNGRVATHPTSLHLLIFSPAVLIFSFRFSL
jgi:hypothetical protein